MLRHRVIVGLVVLGAGVGCGADAGDEEVRAGAGRPTVASADLGPVVGPLHGTFTVLESAGHGPQLCSEVAGSYPPQCGGPDVVGWRWDDVDGEESASGTTWGHYEVVGTWDGERLTLTEPPAPPRPSDEPEPDFSSRCPEPPGGWAVVDPATANRPALDATAEQARGRDDFAGLWLDQSINPAAAGTIDGPEAELTLNDPTKLVLNVRVTGDVDEAEAELREVWGGALCVSPAEHTLAELSGILTEVVDELEGSGLLASSGLDEVHGVVSVTVFVDDGLQAELDERYGAGLVEVTALLQPVG